MKRALVLGGGGPVGGSWELGVLAGLTAEGVQIAGVEVVVGTSAGAIVGAQLLSGTARAPGDRAGGRKAPPLDFSQVDPQRVAQIFERWSKLEGATPAEAAAIGALAQDFNREGEAGYVDSLAASTGVDEWPTGALRICVVDTRSGQRRVIDRGRGVPIGRAMAASTSIPGLFPSVEVAGELCMDGQVHSPTNADVLVDDRPAQALIVMPTNERNSQLGRHARLSVEAEIAALEAVGCRALLCTPGDDDLAAMGDNLLDLSRATPAYEAGRVTGAAWAAEVKGSALP